MELNEKDGYWRVTLDLADGKFDVNRFRVIEYSLQVFIIINSKS